MNGGEAAARKIRIPREFLRSLGSDKIPRGHDYAPPFINPRARERERKILSSGGSNLSFFLDYMHAREFEVCVCVCLVGRFHASVICANRARGESLRCIVQRYTVLVVVVV